MGPLGKSKGCTWLRTEGWRVLALLFISSQPRRDILCRNSEVRACHVININSPAHSAGSLMFVSNLEEILHFSETWSPFQTADNVLAGWTFWHKYIFLPILHKKNWPKFPAKKIRILMNSEFQLTVQICSKWIYPFFVNSIEKLKIQSARLAPGVVRCTFIAPIELSVLFLLWWSAGSHH